MAGEPFNFWNEKTANDLNSLSQILSEMSYEEFSSYVNESKNDFANWIEHSLGNWELAEKIRPLLEKDIILAVINDSLGKQSSKLVIGTANAVQEDSLIKEIMQKNEDFFKETGKKEESNEKKSESKKNNQEFDLKSEKISEKEKGSKIVFADIPKIRTFSGKEFSAGIIFGIIMGALLMLIAQQLIMM